MHVGNNIKKALIDTGINQTELALRLGVTRQMINKICSNENINTKTANRVAKALGVSVSTLLAE